MFTRRFKIFTAFGFDVYVDLSWFLIVLLITWSLAAVFPMWYEGLAAQTAWIMGVAGALGLFASILLHELGHALVARRFGIEMKGITLFIFGGVAEMQDEPPNPKAEFLVAIAGPIVSVLIAAACFGAAAVGAAGQWPLPIVGVAWYLGWINSILVAFNMVPAFPLDGGRVLRAILWHTRGSLRWATKITSSIGLGFGTLLILLGVVSFISGNLIGGVWQFVLGMFLRAAAQMSYQHVLVRRALEGETVSRFMQTAVHTVPPAMSIEQLVDDYVYKHHHKMYPVTEGHRLLGCVTIADIKKIPRDQWSTRSVADIFEPCGPANSVAPDNDAMKTMTEMSRLGISRVMVTEHGELLGMVALKDLIKFIELKIELESEADELPDTLPSARDSGSDKGSPASPFESSHDKRAREGLPV